MAEEEAEPVMEFQESPLVPETEHERTLETFQ
jgi:hypothetical protein